MHPACDVHAVPLPDAETNHSSFLAEIDPAAANASGVKRAPSRRSGNACRTRTRTAAYLGSLDKIVFLVAMLASSALSPGSIAHAETTSRVGKPATMHPIDRFAAFIAEASRRFDMPTSWIRAVMHIESVGDIRARSPKGAMGLMQIMPETYAALRAHYALGANPYDPRDNILAGTAYLHEMHDRYGAPGFLAAYNAGPRRYEEHLRSGRPLPLETQRYIAMLAPIVDGGPVEERQFVVADVGAWLHSLLFPVQSSDKPADDESLFAAPRERQPTVPRTVDLSGLAAQPGDLFARRIAEFQPQ